MRRHTFVGDGSGSSMRSLNSISSIKKDPYVLTASILANTLTFALPLLMLQIYDRIIPNKGFESLTVLAVGVVIAIALEMIMRVARSHLMSLAGDAFARAMHRRVFDRLLKSNLSEIEKDPPGVHLDRISSIDRVRELRFGETAMALLDLPFAIIFLVAVAFIAPPLAAMIVVLMAVAYLITSRLQAGVVVFSEKKNEVDRRRYSFLLEVLTGIEPIKSFNLEAFMERRYERLMGSTAGIGSQSAQRSNFSQAVTGAIGQYTPAIVAGCGSILVMQQSITVGSLAAVTLLASRIVQPVLRLSALKSSEDDMRRAEMEIEKFISAADKPIGSLSCKAIDSLVLSDICVTRPGQSNPMYSHLNLELSRGDVVVIDGANGSGRSSLLWLIMGYFYANSGEILINGKSAGEYDPADLRQRIAYLPPQPKMLAGTVLENMTNFQPEKYLDEVFEIADALGVASYFAVHKEGLNTQVGHGLDAGLPTSVCQRVPLVGALVGKPDLILFDEANANLDFEGDQKLLGYLKAARQNAAIIMVTQRPSYAAIADRHYVLDGGALKDITGQSSSSWQNRVAAR